MYYLLFEELELGFLKKWLKKRKLKKYMEKTPEEEYAIYKKRIMRGESETSARAGLKHIDKYLKEKKKK
jgi:hypothetical protein